MGPLKSSGTVGFTAFRDQGTEALKRRKPRKQSGAGPDDSDDEEDDDGDQILEQMQDTEDNEDSKRLAPEVAEFQGELADGVNRIRVSQGRLFWGLVAE